MTTFLRILRLIALSAWVGSLIFFGFTAKAAFTALSDPHQAGAVVRLALISLHHLGLIAGAVYFIVTLVLLATQGDSHPARAAELALIIAMIGLTAYSQYSILPRMQADEASAGGDISATPLQLPSHQHFTRLHHLSVRVEGAILIEGLLLLILAPIHGRDNLDRFL
jgi:D-alanyl-lipoteichoic acid acyltransferase DltB (MBOAT superfamily)